MNTRDISSLLNKSLVTSAITVASAACSTLPAAAEAAHHSLADAAIPASLTLAGGSALGVLAASGAFRSHEDAKDTGLLLTAMGSVLALEGILVGYVMDGAVKEGIKLAIPVTGVIMSPFFIAASVYMLAHACGMARYRDDEPIEQEQSASAPSPRCSH